MEINGGNVVYELLGDAGNELIALTPGGRFSKDIPGLRPLAEALVDGGKRVLLWDRPNCGVSDVQFYAYSESHMRAETLRALLTGLGEGPCVIAGGSGGARDSILTTILYPELATKLVVWNIVGGNFGSISLASYYVLPTIRAVRVQGMKGVLELPEWQALVAANPENEARILAQDAGEFLKTMVSWFNAYVPKPGQTIPGIEDQDFSGITVPTLIIRGGKDDWDHPKRTSLEVSCLIEGCELIDPPWPEDSWERATEDRALGKVDRYNMFDTWVQAAPAILDFVASAGRQHAVAPG
jgi:pimeloyl-ACP methyl ester carboxylesterase